MPPIVLRILSALVLAPLVLACAYYGGLWFQGLVASGALLALYEWVKLCRSETAGEGVRSGERTTWLILGGVYILAASASLLQVRDAEAGRFIVFFLFGAVWLADTGAYLFGSLIGGPRLAPRISPNKTWAGLIGALAASAVSGSLFFGIFPDVSPIKLALIGALAGFVSQLGDLAESFAKRRFGVKDSGAVIPGHGGVLDRIDGLLAASLFMAIAGINMLGGNSPWF